MIKYLATIPDEVKMDPSVFINLLKKYRHHRNLKYGFSVKHTNDIMEYRKNHSQAGQSTIPGNLYDLPVVWNSEVTFIS